MQVMRLGTLQPALSAGLALALVGALDAAVAHAAPPEAGPRGYYIRAKIAGEKRRAYVIPGDGSVNPPPALLYFHGRGGTLEYEREFHRFEELWPAAVVVYMEGTPVDADGVGVGVDAQDKNGWTLRFPHKYALGQTKDIEYVRYVLERVTRRHRIDAQRTFAAGHSSGGFLVLSLMELMPDDFAGFAVVGAYARYKVRDPQSQDNTDAVPVELDPASDVAKHPRQVLYLFGDGDTVFNNDSGGRGVPGWSREGASLYRSTLQQLFIRNRCDEPAGEYWARFEMVMVQPRVGDAGAAPGAPVTFRLYAGGHSWPRGPDADAHQWVVDFFKSIAPQQ